MKSPLVTIGCITYNQEKYIEKAIESFLMQKVSFPYEIIIHDDASTDRTAEIINKYASKYCDIIKPLIQKENQYSKGKKPFIDFVFPQAKGKYIALCEGDDYWTDPYKLQKQVEFLENNNEYVICGHGFIVKNENKNNIEKRMFAYDPAKYGSFRYLRALKGSPLFTNTWLFHRDAILGNKYLSLINKISAGDDFVMLLLMSVGRGYCLPEFMSVYRVNDSSTWSSIKTYIKKLKVFAYQVYSFQVIPLRFYIPQIIYSIVNLSDAFIEVFRNIIHTSDLKELSMFKSEISKIDANAFFVLSCIVCAFLVIPLRIIILILAKIFKKIHLCV
ncbi:MAG: glycosyltransferase [Bacteroidales bacterium]|nr:glycosyltransferase [Bacteroidales bacterium]